MNLIEKITSRRFLTTIATMVIGCVAIFSPEHEAAWQNIAQQLVGLVVVLAAALGYNAGEAHVDASRNGK